jgi:hypothetical protein
MDLPYYLGFDFGSQNHYVIAQFFTEPIDAQAFGSCFVSVVFALLVHGFLMLLTSIFYRI